ncbi:MAG: hypothetical protein KJ922_02845, partial [Nanoarchaeota archaeon]|nr:hypothetical protein [Nanoarchaeota archaeon]
TVSDKTLVIAILVIIGLFSAFFLVFWYTDKADDPKTIQEMHELNLKGKLDKDEGYVYNGFSFVNVSGMWFTQVQRFRSTDLYNVQFHYSPEDVESIPVVGDVDNFKDYNGTYIAFDPTSEDYMHTALAAGELSINLATVFKMLPIAACTKNTTEVCYTRPIVSCMDSDKPIILFDHADKPAVIRENEACIRITGNGTDLVKGVDRLFFQWFEIMR